jgi:hypothetical protein
MSIMASSQEASLAAAHLKNGVHGLELVIPLPAGMDASALPALGRSLGRALQVVALDGAKSLLARADAVATAAIPIAEPSIELIEERVAQRRTMQRIVEETTWVSAEQIRKRLRKRVAPTADWKRRGKIFGLKIGEREFFAAWQFGEDNKPLPVIADALKALGPIADPWKIAAWFHFPNTWLAKPQGARSKSVSRAPKDCLEQRGALLEAATKRNASYVA